MGCHAFLQAIFLIQVSNQGLLCLLHWQMGSLPQCYLGIPHMVLCETKRSRCWTLYWCQISVGGVLEVRSHKVRSYFPGLFWKKKITSSKCYGRQSFLDRKIRTGDVGSGKKRVKIPLSRTLWNLAWTPNPIGENRTQVWEGKLAIVTWQQDGEKRWARRAWGWVWGWAVVISRSLCYNTLSYTFCALEN